MKTPKERLQEYVPHRTSFLMNNIVRLVAWISRGKEKPFYKYNFNKEEMKGRQVLVLADHASRDNFYYCLSGYPFQRLNPVMGYQNFFNKTLFKGFLAFGAIPKMLYAPDFKCTRNILRMKNEGCSFLLFPEGIESSVGISHPINPATFKLVKKCALDVVMVKSFGSYLALPKFTSTYRHGKMTFEYTWLFTKEDVLNHSDEELYKIYLEKFKYNDFEYNEKEQNHYIGKEKNAAKLDSILYYCPRCSSEFKLYIDDENIVCKECGNTIHIDDTYKLTANENSILKYNRIDKWFNAERDLVKKEISNPDFKLVVECDSYKLEDEKLKKNRYSKNGHGTLTLDQDSLNFKGMINSEDVDLHFDIKNLPSLSFLTDTNANQFYFDRNYYQFRYPNNPHLSTKMTLFVEELHNIKDEDGWGQMSKDVRN